MAIIYNSTSNENTLLSDVLLPLFGDNADSALFATLFMRAELLNLIKTIIDTEDFVCIKEFADYPKLNYLFDDTPPTKLRTDQIIISNKYTIDKIEGEINKFSSIDTFVVEALQNNNINLENWDNFLNTINNTFNINYKKIYRISIPDIIETLKMWDNLDNTDIKNQIKSYNSSFGIDYNYKTYWREPLKIISKNFWKKFSFSIVINDFDIYNEDNSEYLEYIASELFDNGYFDEIVIKINYLNWSDNFEKIFNWSKNNLRSALVSYRFRTVFKGNTPRYFSEEEASLNNDIMRINSMDDEIMDYQIKLPILLQGILSNKQSYGIELESGYFGNEGGISANNIDELLNDELKDKLCRIIDLNPFILEGDYSITNFLTNNSNETLICIKGSK